MLDSSKKPSTETPWGLSWDDLLASLRPIPADLNTLTSITSAIDDALRQAHIPHTDLVIGGPFGKGTLRCKEQSLTLYAKFGPNFNPTDYFDAHLKPISTALASAKIARTANITHDGLALKFSFENVDVRIYAAGELYSGPKELLIMDEPRASKGVRTSLRFADTEGYPRLQARAVHVETSCALLRIAFIHMQSDMYKDMVRVAKKWRDGCEFMQTADIPGDYLIELLMLEAVQGAPVAETGPDLYAGVFRRFLSLVGMQSGNGSDVLADDSMPRSFLTWTTFYNAGAIEQGMVLGLLQPAQQGCPLVVVDPAVPFVNVARTVGDWGELRKSARDSLGKFQNSELLEQLQVKLNSLTEDMAEMLDAMKRKIEDLEAVGDSPRRWSGNVQFRDQHMKGDSWASVIEVELRTVTWRVNARRARSEGVGYTTKVDISLQMLGKPLTRTIDVDVNFRGGISHLVFGPDKDHVLITTNSEVIRNRDYQMQITIVA
eukprot:GFKZ01002482.1.p1 GENE.GFKZ01002482.1~~GFKZ01002482.1.p1  ORF type:complete len:522 (+),score=70.27 GFKZ01002482.1:99-1568(+)